MFTYHSKTLFILLSVIKYRSCEPGEVAQN